MSPLINCVENTLKNNTTAALRTMLLNYGVNLQLHRIEMGTVETISVTAKLDSAAFRLNSKYFLIYSPVSSYYVWYNTDYTGVDPLIAGKIGIEVNIILDETANNVAQKTLVEINKLQDFICTRTNAVLSIENRITGDATAPNAGDSTFAVSTTQGGTNPDSDIEYLEVYGKKAGPVEKTTYYTITGIVTGDHLLPVDDYTAGTFQKGWLWTLDTTVKTGDTLYLPRNDTRRRRYIVCEPNILGTTNSVMKKWELSALGD